MGFTAGLEEPTYSVVSDLHDLRKRAGRPLLIALVRLMAGTYEDLLTSPEHFPFCLPGQSRREVARHGLSDFDRPEDDFPDGSKGETKPSTEPQ